MSRLAYRELVKSCTANLWFPTEMPRSQEELCQLASKSNYRFLFLVLNIARRTKNTTYGTEMLKPPDQDSFKRFFRKRIVEQDFRATIEAAVHNALKTSQALSDGIAKIADAIKASPGGIEGFKRRAVHNLKKLTGTWEELGKNSRPKTRRAKPSGKIALLSLPSPNKFSTESTDPLRFPDLTTIRSILDVSMRANPNGEVVLTGLRLLSQTIRAGRGCREVGKENESRLLVLEKIGASLDRLKPDQIKQLGSWLKVHLHGAYTLLLTNYGLTVEQARPIFWYCKHREAATLLLARVSPELYCSLVEQCADHFCADRHSQEIYRPISQSAIGYLDAMKGRKLTTAFNKKQKTRLARSLKKLWAAPANSTPVLHELERAQDARNSILAAAKGIGVTLTLSDPKPRSPHSVNKRRQRTALSPE